MPRRNRPTDPVLEPVAPKPLSRSQARRLASAFELPEYPIISAASTPDVIRAEVDESVIKNRIARLKTERERREFALRASSPGGRDGGNLQLTHRARVNDNPKHADQWADFDTSHPIEKMRVRQSLGTSVQQRFRRYCAAKVWVTFFLKAQGFNVSTWLKEQVDGTGDPEASTLSRLDALMQRMNVIDASLVDLSAHRSLVMQRRFFDLDSVCAIGFTISEVANRTGRSERGVKKSLLSGLDAISGYAPWDKHLESVGVLYIEGRDLAA